MTGVSLDCWRFFCSSMFLSATEDVDTNDEVVATFCCFAAGADMWLLSLRESTTYPVADFGSVEQWQKGIKRIIR